MPRSLRLGFAGTPQFAVPALDALQRSGHQVQAVFTQPDRPSGRGRAVHPSPVKGRALELGIPVHQPVSFKSPDAEALLRGLELDALVVVAYGLILPPRVLGTPRLGCFNIHASLLPRWRGAAPIQRALLAGDAVTGVTIMKMEAGLDTGPMLLMRAIDINVLDTAGTLHDRLADVGADLIVQALADVAAGHSRELPQPSEGVSYAAKISKAEAQIDWCEPAYLIERRVRAFNPWPIAQTHWEGIQLRIWDAQLAPPATQPAGPTGVAGSVIEQSGAGIDVACGERALRIKRLQLAGRKPLAPREFLKAHSLAGARFANS